MILDFFKKRDYSNVVKFPEQVPYVTPPEPKIEPKVYYTFGLTDDNRVTFTMGYTTLTMNEEGIQDLIDQLEFYKNRIE